MTLFVADPDTSLPAWSDRDLEIARLMRAEGKSAAEIAAAFGNGRARNTVIGRLARAFGRMAPRPRQAAISATPKRAPPKRERPPVLAHLGRDGVVARRHAAPPAKPPKPPKQPLTGQALDDRKAECRAKQLAIVARVELMVVDNPAFVKVEKPANLYAHMLSDRHYFDAIAALTRR